MHKVLEKVRASLTPTADEQREAARRDKAMVAKVQQLVPGAKVVLGGSSEKGTWLRPGHDADIFVRYPASYRGEDISAELGRALRSLRPQRLHGSRDYFRIERKGFVFEIVPILKVSSADEAENITDVSPFHTAYVKKHKALAPDIRLLKQMCKAARCYGAESYINGFSGYICEILIIHYGSFPKAVKAIADWTPKTVIDPMLKRPAKKVLFDLDKAKTQGPLVIVDPVQSSRNAAAAVSDERFGKIVAHVKAFVKAPSEDAFKPRPIDTAALAKKGHLVSFRARPLGGKDDIVGCKLLKAFAHLRRRLEDADFVVVDEEWEWDEEMRYHMVLKQQTLPERKRIVGPPPRFATHAKAFRAKYRHVAEEDGRLLATATRKVTDAHVLIRRVLKDTYIKERVAGISMSKAA